jgi:hypothetical protein
MRLRILILWLRSIINIRIFWFNLKFRRKFLDISMILKRCCSSSWNRFLYHLYFTLYYRCLISCYILISRINRTALNILKLTNWLNKIRFINAIIVIILKSHFINYILVFILVIIWRYFNILFILNVLNYILICLIRFLSRINLISIKFRLFIWSVLNWKFHEFRRIFRIFDNLTNIFWYIS